jgi:shikimate kinase
MLRWKNSVAIRFPKYGGISMPTFRTSQPDSAADPTLPHLVLVGLPGSGKSTVGSLLAARLGRTFLDFDQEITRRQGMSVAEIFAMQGEHGFRELERKLTLELLEFGNMIVAPGGGWIGQPEVVALLKPRAKLIYLRLRPKTALARMGSKRELRPLLKRPDPLGEIERLFSSRKEAYETADIVIDVERLNPQQVADQIASQMGR